MIIHRVVGPYYGLSIVIAILIGLIYIYRNLRREKVDKKNILYLILMMVPFIFTFGKIYTVATHITEENNILTVGISSYGGLIGAILASIVFEYIVPSKWKYLKYTILSLPLIYGLSKIACTIVGCCYGIPYNGLFRVNYIDIHDEFVFPVQALEVLSNVLLFLILNRFKDNNNITYITMISAATLKFSTDFLRHDHVNTMITSNQIFSIILVVITIVIYIRNNKSIRHKN